MGVDLVGKFLGHRDQCLEGEIGIDRFGAIARETGEMMDFAGFAGLDDETDRGAPSRADQMMMHGRGGEQRRNGDAIGSDHAVGKDDDIVAALHRLFGPFAQARQHLLHPRRAAFDGISDIERLGIEEILDRADVADLLEILVGENRLAHFEALAA